MNKGVTLTDRERKQFDKARKLHDGGTIFPPINLLFSRWPDDWGVPRWFERVVMFGFGFVAANVLYTADYYWAFILILVVLFYVGIHIRKRSA